MGGGLALAGMVLGTASSIYGGYQQNEYYQALAAQNEKQANQTLKVAEMEKGLVYDKAAQQSQQASQALSQTIGTQKAVLGAANISGSSKTAEDIERSSAKQEFEDQLVIKYNADISAWETMANARIEADKLRAEAASYRKAGKNARTQGWLGAGSSLLGGAAYFA